MSISTLSVPTYTPTGSGISIRAAQSTELLGSNLDDNFALLANKLNEVINYEFGALDGVTFDGTNLMVGPNQTEIKIQDDGKVTMDNVGLDPAGWYHFDDHGGGNYIGIHDATSSVALYHNSTPTMYWKSGKVGIGAVPTHCDLHIKGTDSADGGEVKLCLESQDGSQNAALAHVDENGKERLSFRVGGHMATVEKMTINNAGKVGIGTDNPWGVFQVEGTASAGSVDVNRPVLSLFKLDRGVDDGNGDPEELSHNYSGGLAYDSQHFLIGTDIELPYGQTINSGTYDGGYRVGLYVNAKAMGGANGTAPGGGLDGRLHTQSGAKIQVGTYAKAGAEQFGPGSTLGFPTGDIDYIQGIDLTNYISADADIGVHYGIKQNWATADGTGGAKARQIKNYFASRTGIGRETTEAQLEVHCTSSQMKFDSNGNETTTPLLPLLVSNNVSGAIGERLAVDIADTRITNNISQGTKLFLNNTFDANIDCNWQLHSDSNGEFKIGNLSSGGAINNKIIARTNGVLDVYNRMRVNSSSPTGSFQGASVDVRPHATYGMYGYHMTKTSTDATSLGGLYVGKNAEVNPGTSDLADANNYFGSLYLKDKGGVSKVTLSAKTNVHSGTPERLRIEDGDAVIEDGWLNFTLNNFSSATGISTTSGMKYVADKDDDASGTNLCHMFFTGPVPATTASLVIRKDGNVGIGATNPANKLEVGDPTSFFSGNDLAFGDGETGGALNVSTDHDGIVNGGDNYVRLMSTSGIKFTPGNGTAAVGANEMTLSESGDLDVYGSVTANNGVDTLSDYRLKENIAPISGSSLDRVSKIKPASYTLKRGGRATEGFIAHELEEVLPHAVRGEKDAVKTSQVVTPAKGEAYTPAVEGVEEVTEVRTTRVEKTEPREVSEERIEEVDGKYVKRTVVETIDETVYEEVQVYGEDGKPEMVCTLHPSERVYEDKEVTVLEHDEDGNVIGERIEIQKVQISEEREGCMEPLMQKVPVMIETSETVVVTEAVEAKGEEVVAVDILESQAPEGTLWRETTPESVEEVEEIDAQSVDYSSIIPVLVGAIQELTAKVKELESA